MAHEQMPHHRAKSLGVRRDVLRHERRDHDAGIRDLPRIASVTADDRKDPCAHFTRMIERYDPFDGAMANASRPYGFFGKPLFRSGVISVHVSPPSSLSSATVPCGGKADASSSLAK